MRAENWYELRACGTSVRSMDEARALSFAEDGERFRTEGHAIIDALATYFESMLDASTPAIHATTPSAVLEDFRELFGSKPRVRDVLARMIAHATNTQSPRFLGHQVSAPNVEAALALCAGSLLNNSAGVFEMGPWAAAVERVVVEWALAKVGFANGDGILTSGGSLGNLTALLAARQSHAGFDAWREGNGNHGLCILTSTESHYCVSRAAHILGLGDAGVVTVPVDAHYRLDSARLEESLAAAKASGRKPFVLVVSAASTSTGAFDPIEPAADFCEKHGLWLHVDGAHGGSAIVSPSHAHLVRGIHRADSMVWDAHKMMRVPSLATFVLYRDRTASFEVFAQRASYLFADYEGALPWYDGALRTIECTKPALGLPLFTLLASRGEAYVANAVERAFHLGPRFAEILRAEGDFEVAIDPQINIVCFRYRPKGVATSELSDVQKSIRQTLLAKGEFYIVQTTLAGEVWLRTSLMNPETDERELRALIVAIRQCAGGV